MLSQTKSHILNLFNYFQRVLITLFPLLMPSAWRNFSPMRLNDDGILI